MPEPSDNGNSMNQPKRKSSPRVYTGALAVPLKPRLRFRRPHALRHLRALRAKSTGSPTLPVAPGGLSSASDLNWDFLKSLLQSGQLKAGGANPSVAPAPPMFPDRLYSAPGWRQEFNQKLPLLLDHYGIASDDPDRWQKLCLGLAVAHVPGFQVRASRKKGRPPTVSPQDEEKLYARFCELRQGGQSDRNASHLMAKELRKSGQTVGSDASILRRMQRLKQKALSAPKPLESDFGGLGATQNSMP